MIQWSKEFAQNIATFKLKISNPVSSGGAGSHIPRVLGVVVDVEWQEGHVAVVNTEAEDLLLDVVKHVVAPSPLRWPNTNNAKSHFM